MDEHLSQAAKVSGGLSLKNFLSGPLNSQKTPQGEKRMKTNIHNIFTPSSHTDSSNQSTLKELRVPFSDLGNVCFGGFFI